MEEKKLRKLIELIQELVNEQGVTHIGKAHQIRMEASDDELTAVEEFAAWFQDDEVPGGP